MSRLDEEESGLGDDDLQFDTYLTFQLDDEEYAVPVVNVTEIIRLTGQLSRMPGMARCYRGVLNLRSKVIPVMDVRARFGLPSRDYDDRTVVVVLDVDDAFVGLVVDAVTEVVHLPPETVEPAPDDNARREAAVKALAKRSDRVSIVLDAHQLTRVSKAA
ncbi:MAG: chemotaxis protein CheW [Myxococcota bacterium]